MNIQYYEPLKRGWNRMEQALFHPFDINKWFVAGFTAFLAGLTDFNAGAGGNASGRGRGHIDLDDVTEFPDMAWQWLMDNAIWFSLILAGIFLAIILTIVFTWLSSRGKFMFLDNVIYNRAEVRKPWNEFRQEGNSLFVWRFIFGFIVFAFFIAFFVFAFIMVRNIIYNEYSLSGKVWIIIGLIFQFFILMVVVSYISLFLNDFVVPIMYKYRVSATRGWGIFLKTLNHHPGHFLLYGLYVFALGFLVVICVVLFGLFTCCIGWVLLVIPYIGSVILLPVSWTFRSFSLEFLEQFDEDFRFFPQEESGIDKIDVLDI